MCIKGGLKAGPFAFRTRRGVPGSSMIGALNASWLSPVAGKALTIAVVGLMDEYVASS